MSYNLVIGDNEYSLPADITLAKWVELNTNANPLIWMNSIYGIPMDEVKIIPPKTTELAVGLIRALMNPTWSPLSKTLGDYSLLNLDNITMGEFIDLEVYISEYYTNFISIVNLLYQTDDDLSDNFISEVLPAVTYFLTWRILLYKRYKNLFDVNIEDDEIVNEPQEKTAKPAHIWYDVVMTLADNKFSNMDAVLKEPLIKCLNWLAWNKDKQKEMIERERAKRIKK